MMYWNGQMGVWGWITMIVTFVLFWGAIITVVVLLVRSLGRGQQSGPAWSEPGWGAPPSRGPGWGAGGPQGGNPHGGPEQLLAERFARGEIDEAEYRARIDVLRQHRGGA
ncbi:SHOCT domain-containing protein [Sinomonas halotolerans]|uniref:SHOCT domain-containing protein n=1 Tax=Sinomonas halotolerans TaxID=1644133 RepID=A0ABU9X1V8_9MICC